MKVSATIELIWQLACREAIAAEFKEVAPEHFLMALLKLAETPVSDLEQLGAGMEAARVLSADAAALREELGSRGINSGTLRRELRTLLGRGSTPYQGGQIHRAPASRDYFDKAAKLAGDAGSDVLMGRHLLLSLLQEPTPPMAQVLARGGQAGEAAPAAPLVVLYEHGKDLNRAVAEQKLAQDKERLAEARVLLRVWEQSQRHSAFLASDQPEAVRKTVFTAVRCLSAGDTPAGLRGKRIIDLSEVGGGTTRAKATVELLERLLDQAAAVPGVVLFLPAVGSKGAKMPAWTEMLKRTAAQGKVQFVARLAPELRTAVEKDPAWKRIAQVISLAREKATEIPSEL
ncbi:MAG TPA: hypothetical protein PKM73_03765 [Verrucomicrobiota bacterium]|nr:hypothetical protein [Verrucomicrobiota bacterium]HNU50822.1 hypothetical protein [Verrucomicrobiota bacterium]